MIYSMPFSFLLFLALSSWLQVSCLHKKLSNKFDGNKYDCGASISPDAQYVKIVELTGKEIEDLSSTRATLSDSDNVNRDLEITPKGCVILPKNYDPQKQSVTITRVDESVSQANVVKNLDVNSNKVTLEKISPELESLKCDRHLYLNSTLVMPAEFQKFISDRYKWYATLGSIDGGLTGNDGFFKLDNFKEADYEAVFHVTDKYLDARKDVICKVTIDRSNPDVSIEGGLKDRGALKVEPKENLTLKVSDQNASEVFYCFGDSHEKCDWESTNGSIQSPGSGETNLYFFAVDSAGNKSKMGTIHLQVWNRSLLDEIVRMAKAALALESTAEAREVTKRAKEKHDSLLSIEEKSSVSSLLKSSIFRSTNSSGEEFRIFGESKTPYDRSIFLPGSKKVVSIGNGKLWTSQTTNGKKASIEIGDVDSASGTILLSDLSGNNIVFGDRRNLKISNSDFERIKVVKLPPGESVISSTASNNSVILLLSNGRIVSVSTKSEHPAEIMTVGKKVNIGALTDTYFAAVDGENKIVSGNWKTKSISKKWVDLGMTTGNFKFTIPVRYLTISKSLVFAGDGDKTSKFWIHNDGVLSDSGRVVQIAANPISVSIMDDHNLVTAYGQEIEKRNLLDSGEFVFRAAVPEGVKAVIPSPGTILVVTSKKIFQLDKAFNRKPIFWTEQSIIDHVEPGQDKLLISGFSNERGAPFVSIIPLEIGYFEAKSMDRSQYIDTHENLIWRCDGMRLQSKNIEGKSEQSYANGCESEIQSITTSGARTFVIAKEQKVTGDTDFSIGDESMVIKSVTKGNNSFSNLSEIPSDILQAKVVGEAILGITTNSDLFHVDISDSSIKKVALPTSKNFEISGDERGNIVLSDSEKSYVFSKDLKIVKEFKGFVLTFDTDVVLIEDEVFYLNAHGKRIDLKQLNGRRIISALFVDKNIYLGLSSGHLARLGFDGKWDEIRLTSNPLNQLYKFSKSLVAVGEDESYVVEFADFGRLPRRVNYMRTTADHVIVSFDGIFDYLNLSLDP